MQAIKQVFTYVGIMQEQTERRPGRGPGHVDVLFRAVCRVVSTGWRHRFAGVLLELRGIKSRPGRADRVGVSMFTSMSGVQSYCVVCM